MARFLVTGGAGFIGSHIVDRLVADGHQVRVLDDLCTGKLSNIEQHGRRIEFLKGAVQDPAACQQAVEGIDIVFHEAALASVPLSVDRPLETHAACTTGTLVLLDACRRAKVKRLVYAASSSCYGDAPEMPKREDHVPMAVSPYGAAKLAGELYVEAFAHTYGLETVRLRYFNVFGPRQDPKGPYAAVIPLFVAALLDGRRPVIFGDGSQSRDFTYVANVVAANLLAAQVPGVSGRVFNLACGASLSVGDLLRHICRILDLPFDPQYAPPRTGDILHSWADITAARRDLGYEVQVSLEEGLETTVRWYAAEHLKQRAGATPT